MILIDSSTGSKDLVKFPPLNDPSVACLASLSFSDDSKSSSDVCFIGNGPNGKLNIGIEFKSLSDLLTSCDSGRLQATQIPTMLSTYDVCWIVYYGAYRCNDQGFLETPYKSPGGKTLWRTYTFHSSNSRPLPYGYLESFLFSVNASGVNVKHCYSIAECAQWIGCLYRWWSKPWDKHQSFRRFDKSSDLSQVSLIPGLDSHTEQMINTARSLPGLGFERALEASKHFPSILDMVNATIQQWEGVPKIGKVVAQAIYSAIRRRRNSTSTIINQSDESDSEVTPSVNLGLFE